MHLGLVERLVDGLKLIILVLAHDILLWPLPGYLMAATVSNVRFGSLSGPKPHDLGIL